MLCTLVLVYFLILEAIELLQQQLSEREMSKRVQVADDMSIETAILYQNTPNPFSENTEFAYALPENVQNAALYIYDLNGTQISKLPISNRGNASITINGGTLTAGMYLYSLIVDGQIIDTNYIPRIIDRDSTGYVTLYTGITDYDAIYAKYKIKHFGSYAGTNTSSSFLNTIYVCVVDRDNIGLGPELEEKFGDVIPYTEWFEYFFQLTDNNSISGLTPNVFYKNSSLIITKAINHNANISIYDILGHKIFSAITNESQIDLSGLLNNGIYVYQVKLKNEIYKGKFIFTKK